MFSSHFSKETKTFKIYWDDQLAAIKFANEIFSYLPTDTDKPIVFICIGTDRSTGDSLGPLVGTKLISKILPANFYVYGTLEDPIHAVNLEEKLAIIKNTHSKSFIIGIDACLGKSQHVGSIQIKNGPLKPGAGVQKDLPLVGDIHITGIVNIGGFMEYLVLQNTRLNLVMNLANTISEAIYKAGLLYSLDQKHLHLKKDTI